MNKPFTFNAKIWLYPGESANWHFVTLDKAGAEIVKKSQEGEKRKGWGSVKVTATIGSTSWKTSVFPDKQSGSYLLPIKAAVRKKEKVGHGYAVDIGLRLEGGL